MSDFEKLKDKSLALFFTAGVSLQTWYDIGMIDREVAIYNELAKYLKHIYFFTYAGLGDLEFAGYLADNITIVPKKSISNNLFYSLLIPLIHGKILSHVDVLKTNQMSGSWSAALAKLIYRKKLVVRTGYILSISFSQRNPKSRAKWVRKVIERIAYKLANGIITTSQTNFDYVEENYHPSSTHLLIPNYVETNVFKPMDSDRKRGSICFVGRLTKQKNLFALLESMTGLPYTLTIIGSGEQEEELKKFATRNKINVDFWGNVPNRQLPTILNQHEAFILPSLWEGMPKTLLEAMACGMPVIGTNIDGTREVIEHGENGLLCNVDSNSIRHAIITLMEDEKLRQRLAENARKTILETYSLDRLVKKELGLLEQLV